MTPEVETRRRLIVTASDVVDADPILGRRRKYVLLSLTGPLTGASRHLLRGELHHYCRGRSTNLVLDLSGVTWVDTDGWNALREVAAALDATDRWLTISEHPPTLAIDRRRPPRTSDRPAR